MFQRLARVFFIAFLLNLLWENLHSVLYVSYKGGPITEFVLTRASLFDACVITLLLVPFFYVPYLRKTTWLIFVLGTVIAVVNEWYGLSTGRWLYTTLMPIIPMLHVGLTPAIQLGLLGYTTYKLSLLYETFKH